jgi:hypothetical protein
MRALANVGLLLVGAAFGYVIGWINCALLKHSNTDDDWGPPRCEYHCDLPRGHSGPHSHDTSEEA